MDGEYHVICFYFVFGKHQEMLQALRVPPDTKEIVCRNLRKSNQKVGAAAAL